MQNEKYVISIEVAITNYVVVVVVLFFHFVGLNIYHDSEGDLECCAMTIRSAERERKRARDKEKKNCKVQTV